MKTVSALLLAAALSVPGLGVAADPLGTVTILEGQALIYRGTGRSHAAEGVRLLAGDIVETAPATFVQVELIDRSVVQLGPETRVMLNASAPRQKPERSLYVLAGWVKVVTTQRDSAAGPGVDLRGESFDIPAGAAVVVLRKTTEQLELFVEAGEARVGERQKGAAASVNLRPGSFYQRKPPARGSVTGSATPSFVTTMPRAFRDSLPLRMERFRERQIQPKDAPAFSYTDVQDWLLAEPAVRRPLMHRWRSKASDSAFRAALVTNLSAHPEWDPILFPEKYKPKDPVPVPARPGLDPSGRPVGAAPP